MKIGPSPLDTGPLAESAPRAARAGGPSPVTSTAATGDQVNVSAAGAQLGALASTDFDAGKVEQIRQAIREGRFQVNAGAIADRLIADAAALLGPR